MSICPICDKNAAHEAMDPEKEERLRKDAAHLEEETLRKLVCENCDHIFYVRTE